jgi:hypothetical protein
MDEFQQWLLSLPTQTLTDELKDEIIVQALNACERDNS